MVVAMRTLERPPSLLEDVCAGARGDPGQSESARRAKAKDLMLLRCC